MTGPNPQYVGNIAKDWEKVGEYLAIALGEVAIGLGGTQYGERITESARLPDTMWPNPSTMKLLDDQFPGSAETVLARMDEIQDETHTRELAELSQPIAFRLAKSLRKRFEQR